MSMIRPTHSDEESHQLLKPDLYSGYKEKMSRVSGLADSACHRFPRIKNVQDHLVAAVLFLLPSYVVCPLRDRFRPARSSAKPKMSPTAWLDGLRGMAALNVYWFHWITTWFPDMSTDAYGSPGSANIVIQLPLVRTLYAGQAAVAIFFMISGYVITIKTLSLIYKAKPQSTEPDRILATLCGAVFRRPLRLFLPAIISTFFLAVANQKTGMFLPHIRRLPDMNSQLRDWLYETWLMLNISNTPTGRWMPPYLPHYNIHLWTIPLELKNSILVFLLILAFAKVRRWIHMVGVIGVAWTLMVTRADTHAFLFCAGMILAEMTLIFPPAPAAQRLTSHLENHGTALNAKLPPHVAYWSRHFITITCALLGFHMMGYPAATEIHASGFHLLSVWAPWPFYPAEGSIPAGQHAWSITVGAVMYVAACTYSTPLRLPRSMSALLSTRRLRPQLFREKSSGATVLYGDNNDSNNNNNNNNNDNNEEEEDTSASDTPFLQIPYTTRFVQYMGWVSYSLYLTHGPLIIALGLKYYQRVSPAREEARAVAAQLQSFGQHVAAGEILRKAGHATFSAFVWSSIVQTFLLFWIADVFARVIDVNTVKMTRWIWGAAKIE
ncbi:unnamed protein product [Discula destructiva]